MQARSRVVREVRDVELDVQRLQRRRPRSEVQSELLERALRRAEQRERRRCSALEPTTFAVHKRQQRSQLRYFIFAQFRELKTKNKVCQFFFQSVCRLFVCYRFACCDETELLPRLPRRVGVDDAINSLNGIGDDISTRSQRSAFRLLQTKFFEYKLREFTKKTQPSSSACRRTTRRDATALRTQRQARSQCVGSRRTARRVRCRTIR